MVNRALPIVSLLSLAVILVMLNLVAPPEIGPFGVLFFFILLYLVMLGVATGVVVIVRRALKKQGALGRKQYLYAATIAFAPILLLLIQSLGTMSVFTVILVLFFEILGCFLVKKQA
jgi:hypothetical protein